MVTSDTPIIKCKRGISSALDRALPDKIIHYNSALITDKEVVYQIDVHTSLLKNDCGGRVAVGRVLGEALGRPNGMIIQNKPLVLVCNEKLILFNSCVFSYPDIQVNDTARGHFSSTEELVRILNDIE